MNSLIYHFNLHVTPNISPPPVLNLGQYDNSRTFVAHLKTERGEPYILTEGIIVQIVGKNKFGPFSVSATYNNDIVTFTPSGKSTLEAGRIYVTMQLEQGDSFLTPLSMVFNIQKAGRDINSDSSEGESEEGSIITNPLMITKNGTYTAPSGKAYTPIIVNIANSYTASDEGKVVSNGALVVQTAHAEVTENGTIDTTLNNSVTVNVSQGSEEIVRASWHQCPEAVRNYLAYVAEHPYSTSDWSVSYIANYAPTTPNESKNTKPIGYTIDGVSFIDNEPLAAIPFATENKAGTITALDHLRWYNTYTHNARDLGGWACDGGIVRYGQLVRGGLPLAAYAAQDKALMVNKVGIRSELQLYGGSDDQYHYDEESLWGIDWYGTNGFIWYTLGRTELWKYNLGVIFDSVLHSKPVYFHCGAGKDRTGTIAVMLLALLGVSQSDIDQDYELTTFATGSGNGITIRTGTDYKNYINSIHSYPLASGLADTLQNHAASFVLSLGFSVDTINNFRAACIDGTPSIIEPTLKIYTITKSGNHVTYDNDTTSITEKQAYSVRTMADIGYAISNVSVTMGGTDITNQVFNGTPVARRVSVTNNLSHCSSSNSANAVEEGTTYTTTITASAGYTLNGATISVTMGGTNITSSAYNNGIISIQSVTDNISITITAVTEDVPSTSYSVSNALTNCSTSNGSASISDGSPYSATITPDSGYTLDGATVSITMGGTNITATAYSNGAISIASVTGNVVITIAAVEEQIEIINLANPQSSEWKNGYRIRGTAEIVAQNDSQVTNLIPVSVGDTIRVKNAGELKTYIAATFSDASATQGTQLGVTRTYDSATGVVTMAVNTAADPYARFSFLTADVVGTVNDIIITRNQLIT